MQKNILKKVMVIGIMILLLSTISVGSTSITKQENKETFITGEPVNYLGEIYVQHTAPPFSFCFTLPGTMFYPTDNRDFYFPEINGKVIMNFSINCSHRLTMDKFNFRQSKWDFFVGRLNEADYVIGSYINDTKNVLKETFTHWEEAYLQLETNGQDQTLLVVFYGTAVVRGMSLFSWGIYRWMVLGIIPAILHCKFTITIHPHPGP